MPPAEYMDGICPFNLVANVFYSYFRAPMIPFPLHKIMANNHNAMMVDSGLLQKSEECCVLYS